MNLDAKISTAKLKGNEIAIFWLGQAGFIIKDNKDRIIAIDPYLTDCVERVYGFKRMIPKLIAPHELDLDILIISHEHLDHYDVDAVPVIMSNSKTKLVGSHTAIKIASDSGINQNRLTALSPCDETVIDGIGIKAIYADHGDLSPDALGFLLAIGETKIYYTGDTAYNPDVIKAVKELKPDIAIVPINGQYGNLNSEEAAKLVSDCGAKVAIPCHFWTFIVHRGDPQEFENEMKIHAPECQLKFMHQGEMFKYRLE